MEALGGKDNPLRGNIAIDTIPGREGQILKIALEDKFNPEGLNTANAEYHLIAAVRKNVFPAVVQGDGTIQRYDVRMDSDFKLFKTGNPVAIFSGSMRRTSSYNTAVNANFATYEAEQDVITRLLQDMSEDYVFRISRYLAGKPPVTAPPKPADKPPEKL